MKMPKLGLPNEREVANCLVASENGRSVVVYPPGVATTGRYVIHCFPYPLQGIRCDDLLSVVAVVTEYLTHGGNLDEQTEGSGSDS